MVATFWSGLSCAVRPSVPSVLGTKEGNLFCHNMARGLSTLHLFVWRSLGRADVHVYGVLRAHTHSRHRLGSVAGTGSPPMVICRGSEVGVM